MTIQGTDKSLRIKKQSGIGVQATGAGATEIDVRASQGLQRQVATIESGIIRRSGMRLKARQGSITATAAYETELRKLNLPLIAGGALGNVRVAPITVANTDVTDITISGTGTVGTTTSGNLITLGLRAGMMVKFTGLSVSGNNGVWVPVLAVTATTLAFAPGYLADNALDASFSMVTASTYYTPNPRLKEYFTVEEYIEALDRSKLGIDMRFTNLNFNARPNAPVLIGFGLTGRDLQALDTTDAPNFSSPTNSGGNMMVMLDGALYRNGVAAVDITGLTMGISSQGAVTPLLMSRIGADVSLPSFAFAGQIDGLVEDYDALDSSIAEDQISLMAVFGEQDPAGDKIGVYVGDASYGQVTDPIADGDQTYTAPLYAGEDQRGGGYAASTMVISITAET